MQKKKTWAALGATVNKKNKGSMLVIFAVFIVYNQKQRRKASMIKESITF